MENIVYYSSTCPFCMMAFRLLDKKNIPYTKILVDGNPHMWNEIKQKTGRNTVPQVFINGTHIGGFDDLSEADMDGELDKLITG